jgi:hypothetical protein
VVDWKRKKPISRESQKRKKEKKRGRFRLVPGKTKAARKPWKLGERSSKRRKKMNLAMAMAMAMAMAELMVMEKGRRERRERSHGC